MARGYGPPPWEALAIGSPQRAGKGTLFDRTGCWPGRIPPAENGLSNSTLFWSLPANGFRFGSPELLTPTPQPNSSRRLKWRLFFVPAPPADTLEAHRTLSAASPANGSLSLE